MREREVAHDCNDNIRTSAAGRYERDLSIDNSYTTSLQAQGRVLDVYGMSQNVAPWLQGLDEAWEVPAGTTIPIANDNKTSATHDADSIRSLSKPRRSISGQNVSSQASTQIKRSPLSPLAHNNTNTFRRQTTGTMKLAGTRSVSGASDGSSLPCGTVQLRSKSTSPTKQQETLEWKRRLVKGQVGYGDQTDLFGPSGLDNIFAKSSGPENDAPKRKGRMQWLHQQQGDASMPSSPPPWPSSLRKLEQADSGLEDVSEEQQVGERVEETGMVEVQDEDEYSDEHRNDSFRSNPFDLHNTDESEIDAPLESSRVDSSSPREAVDRGGPVGNRTISGQTERDGEDFSPVFISKHTTINGQVGYTALDSHLVKQFNSMKVDLRHPSQVLSLEAEVTDTQNDAQDDIGLEPEPSMAYTDGPDVDQTPIHPDLSLSENLPTGTPPVASLGGNIELKRGGYSNYGSFKQRPLSPSPLKDEESEFPRESELLSPLPPAARAAPTPLRPVTPDPHSKARGGGSPLKLFGAHDTFTSNRLNRRLSQLEPTAEPAVVTQKRAQPQPAMRAVSANSFGSGQLNDHAFEAEITITSASDPSDHDRSAGSPGSEIAVPGGRTPQALARDESMSRTSDAYKLKRKLSKHSASNSKSSTLEQRPRQATVENASELDAYYARADAVKSFDNGGNKRPPTSPFKNPTPKRRRTLHQTELQEELAQASQTYRAQMHEQAQASTRKLQHAHRDSLRSTSSSSRHATRPRNPTPDHRQQLITAEVVLATEKFAAQDPEALEAVMEQLESSLADSDSPQTLRQQAERVAAEVANFTLKVQRPSGEHVRGERKRSVTTQDFLNEAVMVMRLIRAKARPGSGLGSVEESDGEGGGAMTPTEEWVPGENGSLRISRPPSREGRVSGWRSGVQTQMDARVVSHLRRFQEGDDTEYIAESLASLDVAGGHEEYADEQEDQYEEATYEEGDYEDEGESVVVVNEESNIRITGPAHRHVVNDSDSSRPVSQRSQSSTLQSAGTATGRTAGTNSTRKSDNLGTLAPDAVAHLIGQQVGGMVFDKETQRWVRVKSPTKHAKEFLEPPSALTSDDDPFGGISDLPVDEPNELRRISGADKSTVQDRTISMHDQLERSTQQQQPTVESRTTSTETVVVERPTTRDSSHMQAKIHHAHSSSVPSRYTAGTGLESSQQGERVETRATSWSSQVLAREKIEAEHGMMYAAEQATRALRGEKDDLMEELVEPSEQQQDSSGDVQPTVDGYTNVDLCENTALADESDVEDIDSPKLRQTSQRAPQTFAGPARQLSLRRQTLTSRFMPGVAHEQSELSFVAALPGERVMSVSLSVSRPITSRHTTQDQQRLLPLPSSPCKINDTLLLSDLPDFTVHEADPERPSERALAKRLAHHAKADVNDRYALAVKDLVKTLTDVEEEEPFWEDLKSLDLHDRSLISLYGLEDFCTRLTEMDVSSNALTHIDGAPASLRTLTARGNQLSGLTCWSGMANLQYLDVSGNQLENLDGMAGLVHLRELVVDDNLLTSLDGVCGLDGLLKLSCKRNQLRRVDFRGSRLQRLEVLVLTGNAIETIEGLEDVTGLQKLRLDGNKLEKLRYETQMPNLQNLTLRNCGLTTLDVTNLPSLRLLDADDNCLSTIEGLDQLKHLQLLSMRRQKLPENAHVTIFDAALETRTLRLSGNIMPALNLSTSFLDLQHLELASVGLQELPPDIGLRLPNLRTLNLNFNSLRDIRPLLNIQKLETLSLCGNRLERLRKSVATLAKLGTLSVLDLRDNAVTEGFCAPAVTAAHLTILVRREANGSDKASEEELEGAKELAKHCLPRGEIESDKLHQARMDEETRLRRRVYELLLAHSCSTLRELDGLPFDKAGVDVKDKTWSRLVELGIVRKSRGSSIVHEATSS